MKKKAIDLKEFGIYLVMLLLVLFIALPPLFRALFSESESEIPEVPKVTALICRRKAVSEQYQYNITANSAYQDDLTRITFTYQSSLLSELNSPHQGNDTVVDPNAVTPSQDQNILPNAHDPNVQTPIDTVTPQAEATPFVTDMSIQEEVQALQAIPGIQQEQTTDSTRLILTKDALTSLDASSPYRIYDQALDAQQLYFESLGYSCEVVKN